MLRHSVSVVASHFRRRDGAASALSGWHFVVLLVLVSIYYLFLLSNGTFELFAPELLDQAFNSMLTHLLHGEFTVDSRAIDFEGFSHDGKTYAYFGVFSALLRLVALPFTDIGHLHFARLSCLTAVVIFVALQLKMLLIVENMSTPERSCIGGPEQECITGAAKLARRKRSFPVRSMSLLSRPDLATAGDGAQRRGWEERSHAQHREHGEHRTFPVVSTVAC